MTGKELFDQMLALGGKTQWIYPYEPIARFPAANRAIEEINSLFPKTETVQLLHYPILPCVLHKGITVHRGGTDICYDARGIKSLAFAVSGTGKATLSSSGGVKDYVFEWNDLLSLKVFSGIVEELTGSASGDIRLVFSGEFNYMIKDLSLYDELVGVNASDITTYSDLVSYDISDIKYLGARFLDFDELPVRNGNGRDVAPDYYKIEGKSISIPSSESGCYSIRCRVKPTYLNADNEGLELDIDPELHSLVPLRAAYYLYLISDSEIAEHCKTEYQRVLGIVMSKLNKLRTPRRFRDVRGW